MEPVSGGRTLVLLTNRPAPDPQLDLDRLTGEGGRFDLVARFVNAALLTSHGIREDATALVVFAGEEPTELKVHGSEVTGIGPDERSTAARLLGALDNVPMPVFQAVDDGLELASLPLADVLEACPDPIVHLHGDGEPLESAAPGEGTFVLGGHEGFTDEQRRLLDEVSQARVTLGPKALQADHAAAVLHNRLDRQDRRVELDGQA